ncbi:MAG: hypothetical protein LBJ72_12415, partial [Dysgonamonadaceae bacterium]|nr:hypothetical protein [Dysgonamonadaceae bacterium]
MEIFSINRTITFNRFNKSKEMNENYQNAEKQYREALAMLESNGNVASAMEELTGAADANHAEAQGRLADIYARGSYGMKPDFKKAARYATQAAHQEVCDAQWLLGYLYMNGSGV